MKQQWSLTTAVTTFKNPMLIVHTFINKRYCSHHCNCRERLLQQYYKMDGRWTKFTKQVLPPWSNGVQSLASAQSGLVLSPWGSRNLVDDLEEWLLFKIFPRVHIILRWWILWILWRVDSSVMLEVGQSVCEKQPAVLPGRPFSILKGAGHPCLQWRQCLLL